MHLQSCQAACSSATDPIPMAGPKSVPREDGDGSWTSSLRWQLTDPLRDTVHSCPQALCTHHHGRLNMCPAAPKGCSWKRQTLLDMQPCRICLQQILLALVPPKKAPESTEPNPSSLVGVAKGKQKCFWLAFVSHAELWLKSVMLRLQTCSKHLPTATQSDNLDFTPDLDACLVCPMLSQVQTTCPAPQPWAPWGREGFVTCLHSDQQIKH